MEVIYKYELQVQGTQNVVMPIGHEILSIQEQQGRIMMWAKVDKTTKERPVKIHMFGTGFDLPEFYTGDFLATVQVSDLVWHYFKGA